MEQQGEDTRFCTAVLRIMCAPPQNNILLLRNHLLQPDIHETHYPGALRTLSRGIQYAVKERSALSMKVYTKITTMNTSQSTSGIFGNSASAFAAPSPKHKK